MPRHKQNDAFQRWGPSTAGFERPLLRGDGELPLFKAVNGTILATDRRNLANVG
jgi:hypothetical protein